MCLGPGLLAAPASAMASPVDSSAALEAASRDRDSSLLMTDLRKRDEPKPPRPFFVRATMKPSVRWHPSSPVACDWPPAVAPVVGRNLRGRRALGTKHNNGGGGARSELEATHRCETST